jgi:mRNA interferase RelE/StbE/toxin YoeB
MSYRLDISRWADRIFHKLSRKDRKRLEIIWKKIREILENPQHYEPLRGDMFGSRRVHIDSSFALTYEIDEENKTVRILDFGHHDRVYEKWGKKENSLRPSNRKNSKKICCNRTGESLPRSAIGYSGLGK